MRFMPRLSSGILGKADPIELWEEITSHISDEVLLKKGVKILCVACGHGTEADVLVKRMKSLGISAEEIKESIYLIDKYQEFTNYVIRKGYTNVIRADFMEWETDMKFDVVIGNPPYQDPGGQNTIYQYFYNKAISLVKDGGIISLVTPHNMIDSLTKDNCDSVKFDRKVIPTVVNVNNINRYFPGVGSTFCYFILEDFDNKETKLVADWGESTFDPTKIQLSMLTSKERADFAKGNFSEIKRDIYSGDAGKNIVDGDDVIIFDTLKNGKLSGERKISKPTKRFAVDPYRPKVMFNMYSSGKIEEAFLDTEGKYLPSAKHCVSYILFDTKEEAEAAYNSLSSERFNEFRSLFQSRSTIGSWFNWIKDLA